MDLALDLGMTAAGLARAMTERELGEWQRYAERKMLPQRRIELYLAQIALWVAKTMGGLKDAGLSDFLFDPREPEDEDAEISMKDIRDAFGSVEVVE